MDTTANIPSGNFSVNDTSAVNNLDLILQEGNSMVTLDYRGESLMALLFQPIEEEIFGTSSQFYTDSYGLAVHPGNVQGTQNSELTHDSGVFSSGFMSEIKESSLPYPAQPASSIIPMNRPIAQDDLVIRFDEDSETESDELQVDIDNMSYEEILALEESIGNVNTGLSEQTILARLNHPSNHLCCAAGSPHNITGCCICQEECAEGQKLSKITCGHGFHYDCIKQWLLRKNICPLCKTAAFDV